MARELKYSTPSTDLEALQRELAGGKPEEPETRSRSSETYGEYEDEYEDDYRR